MTNGKEALTVIGSKITLGGELLGRGGDIPHAAVTRHIGMFVVSDDIDRWRIIQSSEERLAVVWEALKVWRNATDTRGCAKTQEHLCRVRCFCHGGHWGIAESGGWVGWEARVSLK